MMTSTLTERLHLWRPVAQLWHGIDTCARFAPKPTLACKTCGRKATGKVSQRGRSFVRLELWQIPTIMEPTESWNWACSSPAKLAVVDWNQIMSSLKVTLGILAAGLMLSGCM